MKSRELKKEMEKRGPRQSQLDLHLDTLFSPKQKELVLKKDKGEAFTRTEREYYSRTVKKKLEALANQEIREIAIKLSRK